MSLGVNTIAIPDIQSPRIIDLFEYIYFDAFTRNKLIHSIMNIINGNGYCNYLWEQFALSHLSGTSNGSGI